MDNLFNKLSRVTEDGGGAPAAPATATSMTTSADIAYARGGLFGDKKKIDFPGIVNDWDDLQKKRKQKMREAIDGKIVEMQGSIIMQLQAYVSATKLTYKQFMQLGGTTDLSPDTIAIGLLRQDADIEKLKTYLNQDIGELELIDAALQQGQSLNKFEEFSRFSYLVGCRIKCVPLKTVVLIYEGVIDMNYTEKESLTIGDEDILAALQEQARCKVTMAGKWGRVFPIGTMFDANFYNILRQIIKSDFDGVNGGEDEQSEDETQ